MFDNLINKIEAVSSYILYNKYEVSKDYVSTIVAELIGVIPEMLKLYMTPEMEEYCADAQYWPQEAEKLVNLMDGRDKLAVFDTLYFEIRPNLSEFARICDEKGLKLN